MGNNVVKSILVAALLIVLSFSVGVTAAEDAKGAGMIIAASCALVAALCVGKKAWLLLLFLPYHAFSPVWGVSFLPTQILTYAVAFLVLLYWLSLKIIGNVNFEWKSMPVFDVLFISLIIVGLYAFYRHPVSIGTLNQIMGTETQYVGGTIYYLMFIALLGYIAYSVIPMPLQKMEKYVKSIVWFVFICAIIYTIRKLLKGNDNLEGFSDTEDRSVMSARISAYLALSIIIMMYVYGSKKIGEILKSPKYIILMFFAASGVMVAGSRGQMARVLCMMLPLALMKGEFKIFVLLGGFGLSALFVASDADVLRYAPYGLQRVASAIPSLKVDSLVRRRAQGSLDTRFRLWDIALDHRTGYIKNYVWGDGFGMDRKQLSRTVTVETSIEKTLMSTGEWHSGPISMIHRLGYVGFSITTCIFLYMLPIAYRTMKAYQRHPLFPAVILIIPHVYGHVWYMYGAVADFRYFFQAATGPLFMLKVFYCEGIKNGIIKPLFARSSYVPLAIQERQYEEPGVPEYPLPRKLKALQNK